MTSYPQQPLNGVTRGLAENRLADPGVRLILSMSPQNGAVKPLPENLDFQELSNGSFKVTFPDGSIRELVPGAEGEGRMVTTLPDGTRIQSDLMMTDGQVTIASISSTGEKTFLSLNENGANMQRITSDGEVSNVIPESAPELIQSFREAEAFSQAEELREQVQFQANSDFGDWNNFGKPADWQPEQNWQPPQFDGGYNQPMLNQPPTPYMPPQGNWQPQPTDGFLPSAPTDSSGFPIGPSDANAFATQNLLNVDSVFANAPDFGSVIEAMPVDSVDDSNSIQQIPPQY